MAASSDDTKTDQKIDFYRSILWLAVPASFALCVLMILSFIHRIDFSPPRPRQVPFSATKWAKGDPSAREAMLEDLVGSSSSFARENLVSRSDRLRGAKKLAIAELLGEPDQADKVALLLD